ncbi:hypothetical protein JQ600_35380 [Bradyrhizobium sp. AUGA SZCCT0176]|uniref:hypothetical protein n=1 Tax=Bradyrhizobium sp. AUGA SZCCT0176 TaxID=2807664 RepID=UPI001BA780C7|nr:hypothetical protein [Bradyrhizobium sp. AUGA SZCCT0176]MBR1230179.1 hypothetical protein [Bradyrhizobium sp. AUGA SZCCT0176]
MIAYWDNETGEARIVEASLNRQVPHPSPESIVAAVLADSSPPAGVRQTAHQITKALRDAGWRILR